MLTPKPQLKLSNAKGYFREHLAVGDYYMDGHVVAGEWRGVGAAMLGLEGRVTEEAFQKLCDGLNPETGEWLTARRNTTRREGSKTVANRRVFYDFTISPPKSVSVVALYQDARIVELHDRAVRVMLDELEKYAETRVRIDGANDERATGGVIAAMFRHDTSRELDPHLHTHCIVFNATYDSVEDRWKALHATGMYRAQKYAEHLYYHELAKGLRGLGYEIENNARDFEIKGVPAEVISRFSKRHHQIGEETKKRIAEEGLRGNEKALREQVAHDRRKRKTKNAVADRLRPRWEEEMPRAEREALTLIAPTKLPTSLPALMTQKPDVSGLAAWADRHLFERKAVLADHELLAAALARGRGENFTLEELEAAVMERGYIFSEDGRKLTSREALTRELKVALCVEDGANRFAPLNAKYQPSAELSDEQRKAVCAILSSRDFVTLFRGGAGTGKSFTLREVVRGLEEKGHRMVIAAPQHQQADGLRSDGLTGAITLARLLAGATLPSRSVVIVDESGQIGGSDMLALMKRVQSCGGRLILSGDTRQQGAVAASDALRVIEENTNVRPVCLSEIRRQDPKLGRTPREKQFIKGYRDAVAVAANGDTLASFDKLDALGAIQEMDGEELRKELAHEYRAALDRKEKVLAVAQTWTEVRELNAAIREELKNAGKLKCGVPISSWQSLDLTDAQKRDARFYPAGSRVFFVREYGRFGRGDWGDIVKVDERGIAVAKDGHVTKISMDYAERFVVAGSHDIELTRGDRLQMKFNGQSADGKPIRNGELVTVKRMLKDGRIRVRDDSGVSKTLTPSQRMFVPGYAVTSYASQGKTVDTVLAAFGERDAMPVSTNGQQWYVAISRARKKVLVLTEDKEALRLCVERESDREAALSIEPAQETFAAICEELPGEMQKLLREAQRIQRHKSVMRWVRAAKTQTQDNAHAVPPPIPQIIQQAKSNKGIRI